MNTTTANSSFSNTESIFRRKLRAFMEAFRRGLAVTGKAYMHGVPPL